MFGVSDPCFKHIDVETGISQHFDNIFAEWCGSPSFESVEGDCEGSERLLARLGYLGGVVGRRRDLRES